VSGHEFKIRIGRDCVTGEFGLPGYEVVLSGPAPLDLDDLSLRTVELMNRWLSFWDLIDGSQIRCKENLLQPTTLELLGTHLWNLILHNEVGEELRAKIPPKGESALRLSIEFDDHADATLKGLPWEFLFEPDGGWFLSTKTELLLTRFVTTKTDRIKAKQVSDKEGIRALLIAALPNGNQHERKFTAERLALRDLRDALNDIPNLDVPKPIEVWDQGEVSRTLKSIPAHIIHVLGICRGTPGKPEIYLGGGGDGFKDPGTFISALTEHQNLPGLIILQLCDYEDGDASESFERLAPALIKHGVPAVLALQYAANPGWMGVDQDGLRTQMEPADYIGLGKQFYGALVGGVPIGTAVQASRKRLQEDRPDRRFGTPVLYLQEDGALRPPGPQAAAPRTTTQSGGAPGAQALRNLMWDAVSSDLTAGQGEAVLHWLAELDSHLELTDASNIVRDKMFSEPDPRLKTVYVTMSLALGKVRRGGDRAAI
jgi:hypothetical protein